MSRRCSIKRRGRRRPGSRRCRLLGRRRAGRVSVSLAELHAAGVFGFKCFLLDSGVPEFPPLSADQLRRGHGRDRRLRRLADRARRGSRGDRRRTAGPTRCTTGSSWTRGRPRRRTRPIETVIAAARETGCRAHIVHLSSAEALPALTAARADGVRITRGDLPALPDPAGRGHRRRPDPVQVLPAGPRRRQSRPALAGAGRRGDRLRGLRPLPVDHRAEAPGRGRLRSGVGRHLLAPARPVADLDRGAATRITRCPRWSTGWPRRPAQIVGVAGKGAIAVGQCGRLRGLRPGRELHRRRRRPPSPQRRHALPRANADRRRSAPPISAASACRSTAHRRATC